VGAGEVSDTPPPIVSAPAEPSLLTLAAMGDREAQSAFAVDILEWGNQGLIRPLEAWAGVELLTRLAAVHREPADVRALASVLFLRGAWEREHGVAEVADNLEAEAIQILDDLANQGDDEASAQLLLAGKACSIRVLELARGESLREE
jgi:hypothetical protein